MTQSMSRDIPLALIDRDPGQPRRHFDDVTLGELADSVRASGLAVLIMVRPVGERFAIVHGERRWRAAGLLGWETIRAEVRDVDEDGARWLALVENVQRADLTPIEEATAFRARLDGGMTQEALGQRIGKGQSYIAQKLRLLALPAPIRLYLECGALTEGHGRQLLRMKAMYGGLETTFRPGTLDDWPPEVRGALPEVGEARRLALWFNVIRIEDHPIMFVEPRDERETRLFAEAAERFRSHLVEHDGTIPLWHLGAFWKATVAVNLGAGVADLAIAIDRWRERFTSALAYWFIERGGLVRPPEEPDTDDVNDALLYWGYLSDLRHGRVLAATERRALPAQPIERAAELARRPDGIALPTSMLARKGAA